MAEEKKGLSRRDLLFGALRKLRRDDEPEDQPRPKARAHGPDHYALGTAAYARRDYPAAMDHYRQLVKAEADHVEGRRRLGYCLYRMEQYIQAKVEFERVLHDLGKDNFSFLYLGLTLARMNRPDKAVAAWKQYFNPEEVRIARELNLQCALLESPDPPEPSEAADEVEEAVEERKSELAEAAP